MLQRTRVTVVRVRCAGLKLGQEMIERVSGEGITFGDLKYSACAAAAEASGSRSLPFGGATGTCGQAADNKNCKRRRHIPVLHVAMAFGRPSNELCDLAPINVPRKGEEPLCCRPRFTLEVLKTGIVVKLLGDGLLGVSRKHTSNAER